MRTSPSKTPTTRAELEVMEAAGWDFINIQSWGGGLFLVVPDRHTYEGMGDLRLRENYRQTIEVIDLHGIDLMQCFDGDGITGGGYGDFSKRTPGGYNRLLVKFERGTSLFCYIQLMDDTKGLNISGIIQVVLTPVETAETQQRLNDELGESENPILSPSAGGF